MSIDIMGLFKRQSFTERPPERQMLVVPVHERINNEPKQAETRAILTKAAEQIARSARLWKWPCYDGSVKLVRWDEQQHVFLRCSLQDWILFFGKHWRCHDATGREYLGPSNVVCDRLISAILAHPSTPIASWALQLQRKREATK